MEYIPRYSQPFTLQEARQLEVPIITEEIARLQNSLAHLERTQGELKDALEASPDDVDLTEAFEENEVVIGSQKERINLLKIVLVEKGVSTSAHYDAPPDPAPPRRETSQRANGGFEGNANGVNEADRDGVYL